jgi:hypothetical protein
MDGGRKAQNLFLFGRISFGASMGYHMIYLALNIFPKE